MTRFAIILLFLVIADHASPLNQKFEKWKEPGFFRGFNILYETPKTLQDFSDLKNYGGNLFQIGTRGFRESDKPYRIIQANIDSTDKFVAYCRKTGIYYVIAVRSGPGAYDVYEEMRNLTGESRIWNKDNSDERMMYAEMLVEIVKRYSDDSLFAGINIIVEPRPKINSIPANSSGLYKRFLEKIFDIHMDKVYEYFVNEIRKVSTDIPIIVENFALSTPELFPAYRIRDSYIVYDAHMYVPYELTHNDIPYSRTYPGEYKSITKLSPEYHDREFLQNTVLRRLRNFQLKTKAPIFIGEFGMKTPQNGGYLYIEDMLDIFADYGWHFAIWDWRRNEGQDWNLERFEDRRYWEVVVSHLK